MGDRDRDLAGRAVLHLSQEASMTIADLQRLQDTHPSFSSAKWETVAPALSLEADLDLTQFKLDSLVVPTAFLPPSFHRELMKKASLWLDVYWEPWGQVRGRTRAPSGSGSHTQASDMSVSNLYAVVCSNLRLICWSPRRQAQNTEFSCSITLSCLSLR